MRGFRGRRLESAFRALRGSSPSRLRCECSPIPAGDPRRGRDILRGRFEFRGEVAEADGGSIFDATPPSAAWRRSMSEFSWLPDLCAAGGELSRAHARALIGDWLALPRRGDQDWSVSRCSRRLMRWLGAASHVLRGAEASFHETFFRGLGLHVRSLSRRSRFSRNPSARFDAATALAWAAICLDLDDSPSLSGLSPLRRVLSEQILPDGGHVSRDAGRVVDVLADLTPLTVAMSESEISAPSDVLSALDRMTAMTRMMRHGDGGLACFHGLGGPKTRTVRAVLSSDRVRARPLDHARSSGYCRLSAGGSTALIDAGAPPPRRFAASSGRGWLSFEFSDGAHRVIVNCGAREESSSASRELARDAEARSAVCVYETPSRGRGASRDAPSRIVADVARDDDQGLLFDGACDAYLRRFGVIHRRRLWLRADGSSLVGEDVLAPPDGDGVFGSRRSGGRFFGSRRGARIAARFHVHPSATVSLSRDRMSASVSLPNRNRWRFRLEGGRLALESDLYGFESVEPRDATQISATAPLEGSARLRWELSRAEGGSPRRPRRPRASLDLPLESDDA